MRADRLLSLMLLLHARGRMTANELAARLEVSERTVYRDIDALSIAGVPVYTQPGTNGGVFLDEGYRVSLTGLSKEQVLSLFVSSDAGPLHDLGLADAVRETLLKLFAALPATHQQDAAQMRQRIHIDPANWFQRAEPSAFLPVLQQAVWEDRQVQVVYQIVEGEVQTRTVDAIGLVAKANVWYFVGRKPNGELRNYRLGRLREVVLCEAYFTRDPDFDLATYWKESCEQFERESNRRNPPYPVILRVHETAYWYFPGFMEGLYERLDVPDSAGWSTLRVTFHAQGEALACVLGLGTGVRVIEPDTLNTQIKVQAQAILDALT